MSGEKNTGRHTLFVDGSAGNGKNGCSAGAALYNPSGERVWSGSRWFGKQSTSSQSEYRAMKFGLDKAAQAGVRNVTVKSDNKSAVNQMKGTSRVASSNIKGLHTAARNASSRFTSVQYEHIPRGQNSKRQSSLRYVIVIVLPIGEANKLARSARKK